jgi:hypothetical protein
MPYRGVNRLMPYRGVNRLMPYRGVNRLMPYRGVNRFMPHPVLYTHYTFILVIVYEHNGNVLLEWDEYICEENTCISWHSGLLLPVEISHLLSCRQSAHMD